MIYKHPAWMTREGSDPSSPFFVVQERALTYFFGLFGRGLRDDLFERGIFPWDKMIADLPGTYRGEEGQLPTRAVSCRLIDEASSSLVAEPVYQEQIDEAEARLIKDPHGRAAVAVHTSGLPRDIGQPKIIVPHFDHVIVRIAWISSVPVRMRRESMSRAQVEKCGAGAWSYTPVLPRPVAFWRYLLAFWEVPLT